MLSLFIGMIEERLLPFDGVRVRDTLRRRVRSLQVMLVAWTLIILIAIFDCTAIALHPEWESNPVQCYIITRCDVYAAIALRLSTIAFACCLMPFAGRLRVPGTVIVLTAHVYIAVCYLRILWVV